MTNSFAEHISLELCSAPPTVAVGERSRGCLRALTGTQDVDTCTHLACSPTGVLAALVMLTQGLLPGQYCWGSAHLDAETARKQFPQNLSPALARWEEKIPMGCPNWSWKFVSALPTGAT